MTRRDRFSKLIDLLVDASLALRDERDKPTDKRDVLTACLADVAEAHLRLAVWLAEINPKEKYD